MANSLLNLVDLLLVPWDRFAKMSMYACLQASESHMVLEPEQLFDLSVDRN